MKGIVLAGGSGSRLYPMTLASSKQLLPVYDKPMVYYPLTTLMLAGLKEILVICTPQDIGGFQRLLGSGQQWGIKLQYAAQDHPAGIAQAFLIAEDFLAGKRASLILGDNIFFGKGLPEKMLSAKNRSNGATVFAYQVHDPERYGVVEFDTDYRAVSITEKPTEPCTDWAVTGLYFYDADVVDVAKSLKPSARGELEITDINKAYLNCGSLHVERLGRGFAWLDAGTPQSLLDAASFIQTLESRQRLKIACPEEVAYHQGWIGREELQHLADKVSGSAYGTYLQWLVNEPTRPLHEFDNALAS